MYNPDGPTHSARIPTTLKQFKILARLGRGPSMSLFDDIDSRLYFAGSDYAYGWRGVCVDGALEKGMTTAREVINTVRDAKEQ